MPRSSETRASLPPDGYVRVLVISSDSTRRQLLEQACIDAAPRVKTECLPDISTAMFRLAANGVDLVVLDEVSLGALPTALEGMMRSLNSKLTLLTVVASTAPKSRARVEATTVTSWVSSYCSRCAAR